MERITVKAHFHTAHRQLEFPGHCRYVHGHTWRGRITIDCEAFPRDHLDVSLDFGDLKKIMRRLDHRIIITSNDPEFNNPELFDPEGVVLLEGKGPSVENVAWYVWKEVVKHIQEKFPDHGIDYQIEVEIQETDNNFFTVMKSAKV